MLYYNNTYYKWHDLLISEIKDAWSKFKSIWWRRGVCPKCKTGCWFSNQVCRSYRHRYSKKLYNWIVLLHKHCVASYLLRVIYFYFNLGMCTVLPAGQGLGFTGKPIYLVFNTQQVFFHCQFFMCRDHWMLILGPKRQEEFLFLQMVMSHKLFWILSTNSEFVS